MTITIITTTMNHWNQTAQCNTTINQEIIHYHKSQRNTIINQEIIHKSQCNTTINQEIIHCHLFLLFTLSQMSIQMSISQSVPPRRWLSQLLRCAEVHYQPIYLYCSNKNTNSCHCPPGGECPYFWGALRCNTGLGPYSSFLNPSPFAMGLSLRWFLFGIINRNANYHQ